MSSVIDSIKGGLNTILGVRDRIGAVLVPVSIVTRTWDGTEIGDGEFTESKFLITPSPKIVDLSQDIRLMEGGIVKQGDIILKMVSKVSYPERRQIDGTSTRKNVERFYELGTDAYTVMGISEKFLWWNIHIRRVSGQQRPARSMRR